MISIKHEMDMMTPTGKSAPYPNMTDEELEEFEHYMYEHFNEKPLYEWSWYKK